MADNIKISQLDALTAAQNSTVVPVVDGGTTKKMSLSTLQTHLTASFATPANLSSEVSTLNSTINALTTDDIAEGSNQYYTNAKVDARLGDLGAITSSAGVDALSIQNLNSAVTPILNSKEVISGSLTTSSIQDFPVEVSRSAAFYGFGTGGGGGGVDLSGTGVVSSSAQITALGFISESSVSASYAETASYIDPTFISESAAAAGFGIGGGGGGTDYVSNVSFAGTTLTFTGVGNAFGSTVDLSTGDLLDNTALFGYLATSVYQIDSASFASRISGGGGGGVPSGTISSSNQVYATFSGSNLVSSSQQIAVVNADLTGLTIDDIGNGVTNKYYTDALVLSYLNSLQVASGSISATPDFSGTNIVSSSNQIELLGFVTSQTYGQGTASLQSQIDAIDVGVSLNDVNTFLAVQKFTEDIEVTGSILLTGAGNSFSGSGANLFGIPAASIVGAVEVAATSLSDGGNSITANSVTGITINAETGSVRVIAGNLILSSGSLYSGSGAGLYDIPGSAIIGGVGGGSSIGSGSITASIDPTIGLVINGDISASGDITARSISVGTSGTPTIYSSNNLNLSASNAVVITDSPLRLTPFTNATTASFTFSEGDLVYSADSDDFYGYRVINGTGSLVSLTAGGAGSVNWGQIIGIPNNIVSSSAQLADLGVISSSAQLVPNAGTGDVMFTNGLGVITSSALFRYTESTGVLTSPSMSVGQLSYTTLSGPAAATGSFNLVDADRVLINNIYELPTSDGTVNQVIKTNGVGTATFGNVAWGEITSIPSGIISSSVQLPTNLATTDGDNDFDVSQTITGSLFVSQSSVSSFLTLYPKDPLPTSVDAGTIAVSGSGASMKPYFWNGIAWQAMI